MKLLSILILFLFVLNLNAQYTITASQKPNIGDIHNYIRIDTTNVLFGSDGVNQSWNYTTLKIPTTSTILTTSYIDALTIPNYSLYPGAHMAVYSPPGAYLCYNNDPNNLSVNWLIRSNSGVVGYPFATIYPDSYTKYHYPIYYGSVFSDSVKYHPYDNTIQPPQIFPGTPSRGVNTYTCSGWGTLNLPNGISLQNTLKIDILYLKYNTSSPGTPSLLWTDSLITEEYFNAISKFPILSLNKSYRINHQLIPPTISLIKYNYMNYDIVNSLKENNDRDISISISPNPIENEFQIVINESKNISNSFLINIFNSLGQKINFESDKSNSLNNNIKIKLNNCSSGIYYIYLQFEEKLITKKILVN